MWLLHRRLETACIWTVPHVLTMWIVKCFHKIFPEPTVCLWTLYDFPFCCESNLFPTSCCVNRCHKIKGHMASVWQQHLLRGTSCGWWHTHHHSACPSKCQRRERTWTAELSLRGSLKTEMGNNLWETCLWFKNGWIAWGDFNSSVLFLDVESREGAGAMGFTEQGKGHLMLNRSNEVRFPFSPALS